MKKKLGLNKKKFFPVSMPDVTRKDIISVNKALKAGWISSEGPEVKKFEKNFSKSDIFSETSEIFSSINFISSLNSSTGSCCVSSQISTLVERIFLIYLMLV